MVKLLKVFGQQSVQLGFFFLLSLAEFPCTIGTRTTYNFIPLFFVLGTTFVLLFLSPPTNGN